MRLALTLFGAIVCASCASSSARLALAPPVVTPEGMQFAVSQPNARSVSVAGNFNQWSSSAHQMARSASGVWTAIVMLPPGEHLFMYVVDGTQWISPPAAEDYSDDGFGAKNGVVIVREKER